MVECFLGPPLTERKWKTVKEESEPNKGPSTIVSVLSYNLLADGTEKKFKEYVKGELLDFTYRFDRILTEVKTSDADIVCLQELTNSYKEMFT
jgi:mRNA deadenylase 3'-5' endonuclease subunit Ccr4